MIGIPVDDEPSLVDLWLILLKQKKWIAFFLLASSCAGVFYAHKSSKVELYKYTTQIELASVTDKEKIDTVENTLAKLEFSYIPYVLNDYAEKNPGHGYPGVKAFIPKKSSLIILKSKGGVASNALYKEVHESIIEKLLTDHKAVLSTRRKKLELVLRQEKDKLVQLLNPMVVSIKKGKLQSKPVQEDVVLTELQDAVDEKRFREALERAKSRIFLSLDEEYDNLVKKRNAIAVKTNNISGMSIAMMIDQDIDRIEKHKQQIFLQGHKIEGIKSQISGFKNSRQLTPMISTRLPNMSESLIISLSVVLGLIAGIFSAFLAEFFTNVRMQVLKAESNGGEVKPESSVTRVPRVVARKVVINT